MNSFDRALERISRYALLCGVALVIFDVFLIIGDALGRSLFGKPLVGTVEIARNTVPLIVFCQAPATILAGRMLRVSALFSRLSARVRMGIEILSGLLGMMLFIALIVDMWGPLLHSWAIWEQEGMAGVKIPLAPVRTSLMVLWIIALLAIVAAMLRIVRGDATSSALETH